MKICYNTFKITEMPSISIEKPILVGSSTFNQLCNTLGIKDKHRFTKLTRQELKFLCRALVVKLREASSADPGAFFRANEVVTGPYGGGGSKIIYKDYTEGMQGFAAWACAVLDKIKRDAEAAVDEA